MNKNSFFRGRTGSLICAAGLALSEAASECRAELAPQIIWHTQSTSIGIVYQLAQGEDGMFYTTASGGSIFRLTSAGVYTTLTNFTGANGSGPAGGLLLANDGNFYGITVTGGSNNLGTLFRFSPSGPQSMGR